MGKKPNDTDPESARMEKKSKKHKNITSDIDVAVPKEKSHKHKEKKKKPELIEDGDEDRRDKGNLVNNGDLQKKDKKKKRKRDSSDPSQVEEDEPGQTDGADLERETDQKSQSKKSNDGEVNGKGNLGNDGDLEKKEKKKKRKRDSSHMAQIEENEPAQDGGTNLERDSDPESQSQTLITEGQFETNSKNEKKKKKKTDVQKANTETDGIMMEGSNMEGSQDGKGKKVKVKVKGSKGKKKATESESLENITEKPKAKRKSKKVSFSGQVEFFPTSDTEPEKNNSKTDGLIRGKRFTPEEDAIVKEAVLNYIIIHNLGDEGLKMVLNCRSYPGMKKCWQEIGTCIPYRPYPSIYHRGHALFEKGEKWTPEEIEQLKELHEKYGNSWKKMGAELGKHRFRVKDMWRRAKFANVKNGKWSQDEYQNLYDLVNMDLQMKLHSEKKSKYGMLRDNIPWTAISEKLTTRNDATCCMKWYRQLTSSLVMENKWADGDDYRMIGALYELDATCAEDVDWDTVLEHRPGDICRKRWDQMVKHIGHQGSKPFAEQVDILANRYCPELAESREAWDNKVVVD